MGLQPFCSNSLEFIRCVGCSALLYSQIFSSAEVFWLPWVSHIKTTSWWFLWYPFCVKFCFLVEGLLWVCKTIFSFDLSSQSHVLYIDSSSEVFYIPVTQSQKKDSVYISFQFGVHWELEFIQSASFIGFGLQFYVISWEKHVNCWHCIPRVFIH